MTPYYSDDWRRHRDQRRRRAQRDDRDGGQVTQPIPPGRAHAQARAWAPLVERIAKNTHASIKALHDAQPGYPSSGDGPNGKGGYSDPTGNLAFARDPARETLEELTTLYGRITADLERLHKLTRNWSKPSPKWVESLATEAAAELGDEHNWCQAHQRAGFMEPARTAGSRLCRSCERDRAMLDGDPDAEWIEVGQRRRHTTKDVAGYRSRHKGKKKRKGKR